MPLRKVEKEKGDQCEIWTTVRGRYASDPSTWAVPDPTPYPARRGATVTARDPHGFAKFVLYKEVSSCPSPISIQQLRSPFIYTAGTPSLYLHLFYRCLLDIQLLSLEQLS